MNFFIRHFEKIIFGAALLALLASLTVFLRNLHETTNVVHDRRENAIDVPEGNIPAISEEDFQGLVLLESPQLTWSPDPDQKTETVFDPREYIYCANPDCPYILTYDTDYCPHCETRQGRKDSRDVATGSDREGDRDRDGLPADYEEQYEFLDDQVAADAHRDHDGDLFTNIEEFKAGTDPSDPGSHPPLAKKVRFLSYQKRRLPFELYQVKTYDNPNKEQWDLFITTGNDRTKIFSLGDELRDRYTITDVSHQVETVYDTTVKMEREKETSVVTIKDKTTGDEIKLKKGQRPLSTNMDVLLVLLDDPERRADMSRIRTKVGEVITLSDPAGNDESYRVRFLSRRNSPALQPLDENGEATGTPHVIQQFSSERDLRERRSQSGADIPGRAEDAVPPPLEF